MYQLYINSIPTGCCQNQERTYFVVPLHLYIFYIQKSYKHVYTPQVYMDS